MAKKAESSLTNMLLSLTVIALVASLALAVLNGVTEEPIAQVQQAKTSNAIKSVVPGYDEQYAKHGELDGAKYSAAYDAEGRFIGAAIEAGNDKGFGGHLQVMVGFDAQGLVTGYQILETHETPGLGAKADQWFQRGNKGDIIGRSVATDNLTVKKDGGSVDAITGSTITSRAFLDVVAEAYKVFESIEK